MNILKLAKECEIIFDTSEQLEAFAKAVIDNYKASLVPDAYARNGHLFFEEQIADESLYTKLYALGETK